MAVRKPLVIVGGQVEQLQSPDSLDSSALGGWLGLYVALPATTVSLANGATDSAQSLSTGTGGSLFAVATDYAARVRIYRDSVAQAADLARATGQVPDVSVAARLLAEVVTRAGALTALVGRISEDFEDPALGTLPITVANLSGSTRPINVTATLLALQH